MVTIVILVFIYQKCFIDFIVKRVFKFVWCVGTEIYHWACGKDTRLSEITQCCSHSLSARGSTLTAHTVNTNGVVSKVVGVTNYYISSLCTIQCLQWKEKASVGRMEIAWAQLVRVLVQIPLWNFPDQVTNYKLQLNQSAVYSHGSKGWRQAGRQLCAAIFYCGWTYMYVSVHKPPHDSGPSKIGI